VALSTTTPPAPSVESPSANARHRGPPRLALLAYPLYIGCRSWRTENRRAVPTAVRRSRHNGAPACHIGGVRRQRYRADRLPRRGAAPSGPDTTLLPRWHRRVRRVIFSRCHSTRVRPCRETRIPRSAVHYGSGEPVRCRPVWRPQLLPHGLPLENWPGYRTNGHRAGKPRRAARAAAVGVRHSVHAAGRASLGGRHGGCLSPTRRGVRWTISRCLLAAALFGRPQLFSPAPMQSRWPQTRPRRICWRRAPRSPLLLGDRMSTRPAPWGRITLHRSDGTETAACQCGWSNGESRRSPYDVARDYVMHRAVVHGVALPEWALSSTRGWSSRVGHGTSVFIPSEGGARGVLGLSWIGPDGHFCPSCSRALAAAWPVGRRRLGGLMAALADSTPAACVHEKSTPRSIHHFPCTT